MIAWPEAWPRRVAVTGASGFLGSHLVPALRAEGLEVVAISRRGGMRRGTEFLAVTDYLDTHRLQQAFSGSAVVVHLAARAHQRDGADAESAYNVANVRSTGAVAVASRAAGVKRVVHLSSIGVNGNRSSDRPFSEEDIPAPAEPYARSKLEGERLVIDRLSNGPTDFVILRPPLVYGSGCPGNFRELLSLVANAPFVPLGSLRAPRRFIHVANLVDAILVAATHRNVSRRVYLLGDSRDVSVAEIVRTAATAMGRNPHAIWNVPPPILALLAKLAGKGGAYERLSAPLQLDSSAFCRQTGWLPSVDPRQGIVESTVGIAGTRRSNPLTTTSLK